MWATFSGSSDSPLLVLIDYTFPKIQKQTGNISVFSLSLAPCACFSELFLWAEKLGGCEGVWWRLGGGWSEYLQILLAISRLRTVVHQSSTNEITTALLNSPHWFPIQPPQEPRIQWGVPWKVLVALPELLLLLLGAHYRDTSVYLSPSPSIAESHAPHPAVPRWHNGCLAASKAC